MQSIYLDSDKVSTLIYHIVRVFYPQLYHHTSTSVPRRDFPPHLNQLNTSFLKNVKLTSVLTIIWHFFLNKFSQVQSPNNIGLLHYGNNVFNSCLWCLFQELLTSSFSSTLSMCVVFFVKCKMLNGIYKSTYNRYHQQVAYNVLDCTDAANYSVLSRNHTKLKRQLISELKCITKWKSNPTNLQKHNKSTKQFNLGHTHKKKIISEPKEKSEWSIYHFYFALCPSL